MEDAVNDTFRELKERIRRLEEVLVHRGLGNMEFAQAVSRVRRAVRHGDRSREPSLELRGLLDRAEALGRAVA
jgi:GTPase involved in cell partitioning and DNA repair